MVGMRLYGGRAAPTRKRAWRLKLTTEELLKVGIATGVQVASLIGHYTFVFLLRRPCLSVFLHDLPVHPAGGCTAAIPLELRSQRVASSQRVVSARLLRLGAPGPAAGVLL